MFGIFSQSKSSQPITNNPSIPNLNVVPKKSRFSKSELKKINAHFRSLCEDDGMVTIDKCLSQQPFANCPSFAWAFEHEARAAGFNLRLDFSTYVAMLSKFSPSTPAQEKLECTEMIFYTKSFAFIYIYIYIYI